MADKTVVPVGGADVPALIGVPAGDGLFPGIVVTHHGPGLDGFTGDLIDKLAAAGFAAVGVNYYHRGPDEGPIPERVAGLEDENIITDISASAEYLAGRGDVDGGRLGIAGHCLGGRNSLLGAAATGHFSACAVFYGGNIMAGRGREAPTPFDLIGDIRCPVIGFFGNDDDNPSPKDVDRIDAEMDRLEIEHTFYRYDGAGHAFQNFTAEERYRPEASDDAQAKLIGFMSGALK